MFASSWHRPGGTGGTGQAMAWPIFQPTCIKSLHDTACLLTRNCIAKYLSCFVTVWSIGFTSYIGIVQSAIIIKFDMIWKSFYPVFQISLGFCALCRRWHIDPLPHPPPPRGCKRPHVTAYSAKLAWPIQFRFPQPCGIVCCIIHFTLLNFRSIIGK